CSTVSSPATLRENRLLRGSTAWIVDRPPAIVVALIATQSPTAGRSRRPCASCRSRPVTSASSSRSTPTTRNVAPYATAILAGTSPASACSRNAASSVGLQPSSSNVMSLSTSYQLSATSCPLPATYPHPAWRGRSH